MKNSTIYFLFTICYLVATPCGHLTASQNAPVLLEQHDERSILAVIHDEVPSLTVNSIKLISEGWDNVVADVNGEWIFRFPRLEAVATIHQREKKLLDLLHQYVTIPIPYYEYVGERTAFVGYRKIPGVALDEALYLTLSEESRQQIADALALFLSQLHSSVNIGQALEWGYEEYSVPVHWIEQSLLGTIPSRDIERIIREALAYYKAHPRGREHLALLHFDLHGGNFAIDTDTHQLNGVFDFSDAAIGDYAIEFGKLFPVHHDLVTRTVEAYTRFTGKATSVMPGAVDHILRRAMYILYARENGDTDRVSQLMKMYERFVPVWDYLNSNLD